MSNGKFPPCWTVVTQRTIGQYECPRDNRLSLIDYNNKEAGFKVIMSGPREIILFLNTRPKDERFMGEHWRKDITLKEFFEHSTEEQYDMVE